MGASRLCCTWRDVLDFITCKGTDCKNSYNPSYYTANKSSVIVLLEVGEGFKVVLWPLCKMTV